MARVERKRALKRRYGLTLRQYEEMLWDQNGLCAICGRRQEGGHSEQLFVDHDHQTGKIRALLCGPCNTGIGHFGENTERLLAAVDYLRKWADHPPT